MISLGVQHAQIEAENLLLFSTEEPLLGNLPFLILYGASTRENSTQNSSRVQAHVYSIAGFRSFPRLTIVPTSPSYVAVDHLPHDLQGDEVYRGLAISVLSYFSTLSEATKSILKDIAISRNSHGPIPTMFDELHAAQVASNMIQVPKAGEVAAFLATALARPALSWIDLDVTLPSGSIKRATDVATNEPLTDEHGLPLIQFGQYNAVIESFGSSAFMPTGKLQRAPSKAAMHHVSQSWSKEQKVALRREMCEFVDTEENYLGKLQILTDSIASFLQNVSPGTARESSLLDDLNRIVSVGRTFYREIKAVLESTESDAIHDLETGLSGVSDLPDTVNKGRKKDSTGIVGFTKALLRALPDLKHPYQEYMRRSGDLSSIASQLLINECPDVSSKICQPKDQYLRSLLIEPVQRLPRYSLFIDNMLRLLPVSQAARPCLLKAREILHDICSLDEGTNTSDAGETLQAIVDRWPAQLKALRRLVTAVDVVELRPPYEIGSQGYDAILLLFPGRLVTLRKLRENALSAHGVIAAVGQSTYSSNGPCNNSLSLDSGLRFEHLYHLKDTAALETLDGSSMYLTEMPPTVLPHESLGLLPRVFHLQAPYHGKAARFAQEITRSKIEDRHSMEIREGEKWSLRCSEGTDQEVSLLAAVTELENQHSLHSQYSLGSIRLIVDEHPAAASLIANNVGAHIVGHIQALQTGDVVLTVESSNGLRFKDQCRAEQSSQVFRNRLQYVLCSKSLENSQREISFDARVLTALPLDDTQTTLTRKANRPRSPVKLISNILGNVANQPMSSYKSRSRAPTIENNHRIEVHPSLKFNAPNEVHAMEETPIKQVQEPVSDRMLKKTSLSQLEDTFRAYVVALRSRSGNVVGKILQARAGADELAINEVYNMLLEDPSKLEIAAVVSVDVLFAAFEKFLRVAWRESIGPLLAPTMIQDMQRSFDQDDPKTFRQNLKHIVEEMSPQNQRSFAATLRLLSDLLDASGNDGDRGVLIASFAEALILTGNPHDYIMLFDRLTDEYDAVFDDTIEDLAVPTSNASSISRNWSAKTNSLNSNASSLRKKFGLGGPSMRDDSKNDSDSKVLSIWRTLSKNSRNPGDIFQVSNSSKPLLARSRSTDTDARMLPPSRPISRDRPPTSDSSKSTGSTRQPESGQLLAGRTIDTGEKKNPRTPAMLRKKRRSSLSDLQSLKDSANASPSVQTLKFNDAPGRPVQAGGALNSPSPSLRRKKPVTTPQRSGIPRLRSPNSEENSPIFHESSKRPAGKCSDLVTITSYSPKRHDIQVSQLAAPRNGLTERRWPPNTTNTQPQPNTTFPIKMKVPSPQKMHPRLSQERKTSPLTSADLQAEMNKIGEDLSALSRPGSSGFISPGRAPQKNLQSLSTRLDALQQQLTAMAAQPTVKASTTRSDAQARLLITESKVAKLDGLYQEANAENEALYERFNAELGKIVARVKKGEGVEELKSKLGEAQSCVRRLKTENAELKREVVELKSALQVE